MMGFQETLQENEEGEGGSKRGHRGIQRIFSSGDRCIHLTPCKRSGHCAPCQGYENLRLPAEWTW